MTHTHLPGRNPFHWYAVLFECMVDRNVGGAIHGQWHQLEGSMCVTSAFIHVVDLSIVYHRGFVGWFRTYKLQLQDLETKSFEELLIMPGTAPA